MMRVSWVGGEDMMEGVKRFLVDLSRKFNIRRISAITSRFSGFYQMAAADVSEERIELGVPSMGDTGAFEKTLQVVWPTFSEVDVSIEQPAAQIRISRRSIEYSSPVTSELGLVFQRMGDVRKLWEDQVKEKAQLILKAETVSTEDPLKVSDKLLEIGRTMGWRTARISTVDPNVMLRSGFKPKASYTEELQGLTVELLRSRQSDDERLSELVVEDDGTHCTLSLGEDLKNCLVTMESPDPDLLSKMIGIWETRG